MQELTQEQMVKQMDNAVIVAALLQDVSVTFAEIEYVTKVITAAANKKVNIQKRTIANVQLFANINVATTVFANAVKKNAARFPDNEPSNVAAFKAQETYFEHSPVFSICKHKNNDNLYLYCIYNDASSSYTIDGVPATKEVVAEYLTPSAARDLLNPKPEHNVTYNIDHDIRVRVIALHNIIGMKAMREHVEF